MTVLAVAVAGAAGAVARYGVGVWAAGRIRGDFPLATLLVNITGSFALGLVFTLTTQRLVAHPTLRTAITAGFLGAYTTFSTFSLETFRLLEDGSPALALLNVVFSVAAGLAAVYAGILVARAL